MPTPLSDEIVQRLDLWLSDLLVAAFDAGVATGMGQPWETPSNDKVASLIALTRHRWLDEIDTSHQWRSSATEMRSAPSWLRAHAERVMAFGPAPLPPSGDPRRAE